MVIRQVSWWKNRQIAWPMIAWQATRQNKCRTSLMMKHKTNGINNDKTKNMIKHTYYTTKHRSNNHATKLMTEWKTNEIYITQWNIKLQNQFNKTNRKRKQNVWPMIWQTTWQNKWQIAWPKTWQLKKARDKKKESRLIRPLILWECLTRFLFRFSFFFLFFFFS